jgi:hypothetical protein
MREPPARINRGNDDYADYADFADRSSLQSALLLAAPEDP